MMKGYLKNSLPASEGGFSSVQKIWTPKNESGYLLTTKVDRISTNLKLKFQRHFADSGVDKGSNH
jgi:hypothetical protein